MKLLDCIGFFSFFCFFFFKNFYGSSTLTCQELGITSDEALSLEELPKRAVILGGGCVFIYLFMWLLVLSLTIIWLYFITLCRYIAVEFASIWRGMGASVDICFRKELPLRWYSGLSIDLLFIPWKLHDWDCRSLVMLSIEEFSLLLSLLHYFNSCWVQLKHNWEVKEKK